MLDDFNESAPSGRNGVPYFDQQLAKAKAKVAQLRGLPMPTLPSRTKDDVALDDPELEAMLVALAGDAPTPAAAPAGVGAANVAESANEAGGGEGPAPLVVPLASGSTGPSPDTVFPVSLDDEALDVPDPVFALTALARRMLVSKDYRSERAEYCRLQLQLNRIGLLAPAYRPQIKCGVERGNPVHYVLLRDQVVIDYHWIHAARMLVRPEEPGHAALLDLNYTFDFATASALSLKNWTRSYRGAEALVLTMFQQCQMRQLRGPLLRAREAALSQRDRSSTGQFSSKAAEAKRKIRSWLAGRTSMEAQIPVYESLWISRELLGPDEAKWIPQLVALSLGEARPLARKTIKDKLAAMDKNVKV